MTSRFDLSAKTALITGGSRGLGLSIAHAYAEAGANIVVVSRKQEACDDTASAITAAHGVKTWAMSCNVSSWDQCTGLVREAEEATGGIDILVNNAGLSPLYPSLTEISEALYDKVFDVNTKGPFRLSTLLGEKMAARGAGAIINVSSIESLHPSPAALPYAAAKSGLNTLTNGLAQAYGPAVRVNTILAGPFLTDISKAWDMKAFEAIAARSIVMRRGGQAEEIVGAALYFASDASSYTTGAALRVDGGVHGSTT